MAKHFEKEHKHVLRDIRIILEADEDGFSESNFGLSSYLTEQNKEMPMYVMSKDGFVLLVMGYTGPEAMRMKKAYIARFNEMEEQLRTTSLQVAAHFGKNHKDVLRDIRVTIEKCSQEFNERNFAPVEYTDAKGERKPPFLDRSGGSCYQKVASSTDSVSAGASYLRKPQLTRRQYHVAVKCQAF